MELKKYKIGDLAHVTRGASLGGEFYATQGNYVRLTCGNFDYRNNCFKENQSKENIYYTGGFKEEFLLEKGDIITPLTEQAIGLLGSTARIPESGKYIQSQDIAKIDCNESLLDKDFAFYLISSACVKQQLSAAAQQTKIRHTSPDKIKECTVWIPSLDVQKRIGRILTDIDNKIAINRQINDNLEAMAKQLYDYWFVQFDFPNEDGKPYKSSGGAMVWNEKLHLSIPSNWEAIPLSEIMDYAGGSQPPASEFIEEYRDGYVRFVQIRDYYSNSHITYIPIRKSNKLCAETDIMIARYGASLGRICYGLNGAYNVALAKVSPKVKEYTEYLRIFLMSDGFYNKINSIGQRAAQAGFNKDDIENILIPFPTNNRCIIEFNKKMQPYFFARLQNDKEINTLTKQRDELLPLLMNGQASVNYHLSVFYTKR